MKRNASLVSYEGSDEEDSTGIDPATSIARVDAPKRKLPRLSPSLVIPVPKPDPSKHHGRIRSSPHVEGQFAAYAYIPVPLDSNEKLKDLLSSVVRCAKGLVPALVCDWMDLNSDEAESTPRTDHELHISLTRPIYLRHHQREDLKRAAKAAAQSIPSFSASFSAFATFENDERTRTFLGVEVGAAHSNFEALSKAFEPTLRLLHQKGFYDQPRFHASIAWALLDHPLQQAAQQSEVSEVRPSSTFPTIPSFPPDLLPDLTEEFGRTLASKIGVFEVDQLKLKIGKDTFSWTLAK